jgi:tetratricopeptide (TPR) repeat protein
MTELEIASSPYILFGDEEGRPDLLKGLALLMTKSAPGDALGWELLGYFGLQSGDKEAIDAAAARLQILAPNSALAPFFSGFSATLAGDRASARAAFAEALRRDPDFAAARAALAQTDPSAAAPAADALATAQRRLTLLLVGAVLLFALFRLRAALLPPVDA